MSRAAIRVSDYVTHHICVLGLSCRSGQTENLTKQQVLLQALDLPSADGTQFMEKYCVFRNTHDGTVQTLRSVFISNTERIIIFYLFHLLSDTHDKILN